MGNLAKLNKKARDRTGWKFQDDYTGAMEYSWNAEMDDNGYITTKGRADKPDPYKRALPKIQDDIAPPWTRPYKEPYNVVEE